MPRRLTIEELAGTIRPGERVYLPGSAGEATPLTDLLLRDPERSRGLAITTTAVPGINPLPLDDLAPDAVVTGLFSQPSTAAAARAGRFRHLPVSYSGFLDHLAESEPFDTCVVHVAPPDAAGRCSLGAAVEFTPLVAARARRVVGIVNPAMPRVPRADTLPFDGFEAVAESDAPLRGYPGGGSGSPEATAIATRVARYVEDGVALQVGLGKVPDALFSLLHDRRRLRLHSGMLGDGTVALANSGALDPDHLPTCCVAVGSASFYGWLQGYPDIAIRDCRHSHGPEALGRLHRFVAVNSALSVDLFGQANLEMAGPRAVSGVGGAADFARAGRQSAGGLSIMALPATFPKGSRIVPRLESGAVSLARTEIDVVVTEHGAADLRGRSVRERAEALIGIAAPAHRDELAVAWAAIADRL